MSVTDTPCRDLTDVTLADEDTNSILTNQNQPKPTKRLQKQYKQQFGLTERGHFIPGLIVLVVQKDPDIFDARKGIEMII